MKPMLNRRATLAATLVLALAGWMSLVVPGSASADCPVCKQISIHGDVALATFAGTATVAIRGQKPLSADVVVTLLEEPFPTYGGLYFPAVMHAFTFDDGSTLTTIGAELAVPAESTVQDLYGYMVITDGTGVFEDAAAVLLVSGQLDWVEGVAEWDACGVICY